MQKSLTTEARISDYAPTDSEAKLIPVIRGEVIADRVEPYKPKRRLNETEIVGLGILAILFVFVLGVLLLPWILKFALLVAGYIFIFVVTKTDGNMGYSRTPKIGGHRASVPGSSIVPRS